MSIPGVLHPACSNIVRFGPEAVTTTPAQVARYAGGVQYRLDPSTAGLAADVIDLAGHLIDSAMIYAVHPVMRHTPEGTLLLQDGLSLGLPAHEADPHTKYLAAAVCTIGAAVETKCRRLKEQGDFLRSLFLDAAGVALLEALGDRSYEVLSAQAQSRGLFTGCRFGPGYGDMPMSTQGLLFELARGEQIGVSLNQHMVMKPGKSLSFFVRFTSDETSARNVYKCQACPVQKCSFRMARGPAPQLGKALDTNASSDLPS